MQSITKADLIERLTDFDARDAVVRQVERAARALGWADRTEFTAAEVIALGTRMAEDAQAEMAASADPAQRAKAAELAPFVDTMKQDILPDLS
jgi:hypothetical protein